MRGGIGSHWTGKKKSADIDFGLVETMCVTGMFKPCCGAISVMPHLEMLLSEYSTCLWRCTLQSLEAGPCERSTKT